MILLNKTPKISVIVPVYKVEKYLRRCLKSIQDQSFRDFEVLVINDDSPDRSIWIAKEFAKNDKRFRVFSKPNGGLSDARNFALDRVRGEYVSFVDGDDHIHKDFLKIMYGLCRDNHADMAYCKFWYSYFNTGLIFPRPSGAKSGVMSREKAVKELIRDRMFQSYAWNKLYKTELFSKYDIRYPYMYFEDIATSVRLLHRSNKLAVTSRRLYYYEKRFGSIVGTMNIDKVHDYWRSVMAERNYFQSIGELDVYKEALMRAIKKVYLINIYSIVRQHIIHFDYKKLKYNLDANRSIFEYNSSDKFKTTEGIPEIPLKLFQPGRAPKKKKPKKFPS